MKEEIVRKGINGKEFLFVQVPDDGFGFDIINSWRKELVFLHKNDINPLTGYERSGLIGMRGYATTLDRTVIIGKANELTEEQWQEVVEGDGHLYADYTGECDACAFADVSGLSLLQSLNLNPYTTLIIQKL